MPENINLFKPEQLEKNAAGDSGNAQNATELNQQGSLQSFLPKKNFFKKNKRILIIAGICILLAGLFFILGRNLLPQKPSSPARFVLEAVNSDSAGINPQTVFILKSSQSINEAAVKKIFKFEPPVDFTVKETSLAGQIVKKIFAAITGKSENGSVFEIKPFEHLGTDQIYRAEISDSDYADHEYSWAFQVKAKFQIIQTFPRNKGTTVPLNSGIEITFNRENLANPQDYFEISPKIDGTFEQHNGTVVFLPKQQLSEGTVYTVTVRKGIKAEGSDDELKDNFSFIFETGEKTYHYNTPSLSFSYNFQEFLPDRKPAIQYYASNLDVKNIDFNVYKFSNPDEFLSSYQQSRKWEWGWCYYYKQHFSGYSPKNEQKILTFKPIEIRSGYEKYIEIPQILEPGYYLLDTVIENRHNQMWIQVSPLSKYFSITHDKSLVWVYDFLKKETAGGLSVSYLNSNSNMELGKTNQDGVLEFATPDPLKSESKEETGPNFLKIQSSGYLPFIVELTDNWGWRQKADKGSQYWSYLSTERFVYKISDTIKFWGVAKGRQADLRQKKLKVTLSNGYYLYDYGGYNLDTEKPFVEQEVIVSSFDTIEGEISFKGLSPGYYTLTVFNDKDIVTTASINVMDYIKPAYQITVMPSRDSVFAGENVSFHVKAEFFDGTPASGLKLEYSAYWRKHISGEIVLNQNGEADVYYTPEYYEYEQSYYPSSLSMNFVPALSEEGEISGQATVQVFGPHLYLQASRESLSDEKHKFTAKLNKIDLSENKGDKEIYRDFIGEPKSDYQLSARLTKITYKPVETGQYYDPIDKVVRKNYRYDRQETTIKELNGRTDTKGEWAFEENIPNPDDGYYMLEFFGKDEYGRSIKADVYVSHYTTPGNYYYEVSGIQLDAEKNEYSIGDNIKMKLEPNRGTELSSEKILYYRFQNSIDKVVVIKSMNFEENFEQNFSPSVNYKAVALGKYGFYESNTFSAVVKQEDMQLSINIEPDKAGYRPGDNINVNFLVQDKDKKPVSSELNIAAVDEAVFHVSPYDWRSDILETLYSNIYVEPISNFSHYASPSATPRAEGGGCFAPGTEILLADGSSKPIEKIKVGDQIASFENESNYIKKTAIVQGISSHLVSGYLIINGQLKVTAEHKIFLNNAWEYAGKAKIGDILIDSQGNKEKIFSITAENIFGPVYNIVVGKYHTYFADGIYVHNQEKGGGETRSDFVDVALFKTVQTDGNGSARISFKAPDNITSWRLIAMAFSTASMKAGQAQEMIKTSLPFFVDATLSDYYLSSDNPYVRLRVFGTDYAAGSKTEFSVKSETLGIDRKETSSESTVFIQLGSLTEGEHEITIGAKQGNHEDTLVRKIKVVKNYFRIGQSIAYELSSDISSIDGNKDSFTKLIFMDAARGRFFNALSSNSFNWGIRADQETAKYFSQKLLTQYFSYEESQDSLDVGSYQTEDGGIAVFPYSDDDLELSAKIADLAPEFIYQDKLKNYFETSLSDKKTDIHRIAKALYGLAGLQQPVLVKINSIKKNNDLNLEDKIYVALALAKLGDKEEARSIYENDIRPKLRFQGPDAWFFEEQDQTKMVKMTAAVGMLVSHVGIESDIGPLWNYISKHFPVWDLDSLEETIIAKNELARPGVEKPKFSFSTNSRNDSITLEKGRVFKLELSYDELKTIKFSSIEGKITMFSFYERSKDPAELTKNSELSISRKYLVNNQPVQSFSEGDVVLVRLDPNIVNTAIDGSYQIIDYLPSGLKPITRIYERGIRESTICDSIWYPQKIVGNAVYFQIYKGFDNSIMCANRTLNYYARVVTKGIYRANPVMIQSMKDLNSLNVSGEDRLEVR